MTGYLTALVITLAIEIPIVALVFKGQRARMALCCLVATTATHLAMHFLLPRVVSSYQQFILVGELMATIIEALVYALSSRPRDWSRAMLASALANTTSYAAGLILIG